MRSFRVTKASHSSVLALRFGPWPGTWTAHILGNFRVTGRRCLTSSAYSRQYFLSSVNKRCIARAHPTLSKLLKLCQLTGAAHYSGGSSGRSSGGRRKDPSLLYGAGWEGGGEDVPVAVWWDFENCNVPLGIEVYKVGVNIVAGLRLSGYKGTVSISAYGDTLQLSRSTQEALASTGIRLHHVPSGGKDASDRALLVDLILWTFDHPPPAHLFLISGDRDFSNALHRLRMRNYNILLACPSGTTVSPGLLGAATHVWQWNSLVRGEGLLQATSPDGSSGGGSYSRHGVPRPYIPSYSPVSRSSDGNGPSSDGGRAVTQMQSRSGEGNSVTLARKPDATPVSPSHSSQKQPLNDTSQTSVGSEEGLVESSNAKAVLRQPPKKILHQFRCLLMSHPNGMMLADLQNYIREGKLNFERDFYGHGKVVPFLSSIPDIVQLERVLMKDNRTWSYNLFPTQESPKSRTEGSEMAESVEVQTPPYGQARECTPAAPVTSSQDSASQIKQEKVDSPPSSPSLHSSVYQGQHEVLSTNAPPQVGQPTTETYEEIGTKDSQTDTQLFTFGKEHKEGYVQADGLSAHSPTSASDSSQKSSNFVEKGISLSTFLGTFVDALRNWQTKRTVAEYPDIPQQVHDNLNEKSSPVDQVDIYGTRSGETDHASVQSRPKNSDTSLEPAGREVEVDGLRQAKRVAEGAVKEGNGRVSRDDASEDLCADKQLMSKGVYESSEVVPTDFVSVSEVSSLESGLSQSGDAESSSSLKPSVMEKDRRPKWKRWLFGPTTEEALLTSEVDLKASPEISQAFQSEAGTQNPVCKETEVDCELSKDCVTRSGESSSAVPASVSLRAGTRDNGDEKLFWGHSFVIRQESKSDGTRSTTIWEELEEYVNSADATLLLSNASNLTEAVHLIKTKGPSRFGCLDSNQISASVGAIAKAKGINWEFVDNTVSRGGSMARDPGSLQGDAARDRIDSKDAVDFESQSQGKQIRIGDGTGSRIQKKEKTDDTAKDKLSLETGDHSSGQDSFSQQYSEASSNNSTSTSLINGTKSVHPSFEEFEEWFLGVVNSAFKRSARTEKVGYNLSLVKPDFERTFGVRLDPRLYGFSRVQDLVASVPSVKLSRPRIDQCTIQLLKVDAEVSGQVSQDLDELVEDPDGNIGTKSEYWPKMYHDCKSLVRELMLENPEGVPGIRLKPLFGSRFNYPLDHKRVGYQRLSDLLRLMPDVVSVNGNLLVPSEEFLRGLKVERGEKKVIEYVGIDADSEELLDELFPGPHSESGENWSEIDKETNGSPSSGYAAGEILEDGRISRDQHFCDPKGPEKHLSGREVLGDLYLSSEDESDSAEVASQGDQFQSFDEEVLQSEMKRAARSHISEQKEMSDSTRSLRFSKDYDFSDEIDELLLEDNHVGKSRFENQPDINQDHAVSADPESYIVEEDSPVCLIGHLHEDWAAQLLQEEIQESTKRLDDEYSISSNGSGVKQEDEAHESVDSRGRELTSVSPVASEEHEMSERETPVSVSDVTPREELVSDTSTLDEERQEELNSNSLELMRILQRKEQQSRPLEESPLVDKSRVDSSAESVVTAVEEPSRDIDVFCYTPSAERAGQAEDISTPSAESANQAEGSSRFPSASTTEKDQIDSHFTPAENAEESSGGSARRRQEEEDTGGSETSEAVAKKSIWRRLFK